MEIDSIHDRRNNFRINSSKQFATQKSSQNDIISLSNTLSKVNSSFYNKINLTNAFKKKGHNFNNPKEEDVNQLYFDNLNEKVFNLYNLVDEIKMKHNNEKNSLKKQSNNPKYYINNEYKEQTINFIVNNDKNVQKHLNRQININKNTLAEMMINNASFKKIILNKKYNINNTNIFNRKKQNSKKNRKVIYSISPEGNTNLLSNYNLNSFSDFKNERVDKVHNRNNNYKLISIREKKKNNINKSPVGRFDSYFFNSYSNTDKKRLNNQVLIKNNIDNINLNLNKKLEIENPACLSYQSILRKISPKEMSIEHNIEYDINSKRNSKNLYDYNNNKNRKHIIDRIPYNKNHNYKFVTENNIRKNYIIENNNTKRTNTLNCDTNLILNYNKFKSTTVSKLIKDYYCTNINTNNNEDEENNSNNSNINIFKNNPPENNSQIANSVQVKTIENKLSNNNNKKKAKNKNNITNMKKDIKKHSPKKVEKIVQNDIEITLEYNKDNTIQQLILNDKDGKKINFIPNDKINNNCKTINTIFNSKKRIILKNKNKNIIPSNSSYSKRNSLINDKLNKLNSNENRSSVQLNKIIPNKTKEKQICPKFKASPQKFYSENLGDTLLQSLNVSSPPDNYIQSTNKKRFPVNSNHKKTSKAFSAFKDTLLKSKNYNKIKNNH